MELNQEALEAQIAFYTKINEMEVAMALVKLWDKHYGPQKQIEPKLTLVKN